MDSFSLLVVRLIVDDLRLLFFRYNAAFTTNYEIKNDSNESTKKDNKKPYYLVVACEVILNYFYDCLDPKD